MNSKDTANEAKRLVDSLQDRVTKLEKENEELRRYPDETHRLLKALLMAGHSVKFEPVPQFSQYGHQLMVRVTTPDNLQYMASIPDLGLLPDFGNSYTRSDGFAHAIRVGLEHVWQGVWR